MKDRRLEGGSQVGVGSASSGDRIVRPCLWLTQEFCSGGGGFNKFSSGQGTENGDLGAVAPNP